ncbi:MAG: VCBS repeat-containing protein [Deltaproteobacteria bacterium]|jgi:hypothetical protein|nr:VCBS repeat-containing protein [Deltaproteobacteria bacterium]MBW2532859.1 VCBS repeat-containing protein [Deltaproteobacteria bacterium]
MRRSDIGLRLGLVGVLAYSASCADLKEIEAGVCGNHAVEPEHGEDCDGKSEVGACGAPGTAGACRFVCSNEDADLSCPPDQGYGCGSDGICRLHTGSFAVADELGDTGFAPELATGDFDGDGRADLVAVASGAVSAFYFDDKAALEQSVSLARPQVPPSASPTIAALTPDSTSDLALTEESAMVVLRGRSKRELAPAAYSSIVLHGATSLRGVMFNAMPGLEVPGGSPSHQGDEILMIWDGTHQDHGEGTFIEQPDPDTSEFFEMQFVGERWADQLSIATGDLNREADSPCEELVAARAYDADVRVISTCVARAGVGWGWNQQVAGADGDWSLKEPALKVELPGEWVADYRDQDGLADAIRVVDVDGDGHLDLLVAVEPLFGLPEDALEPLGVEPEAYVAYGNGTGEFSSPTCRDFGCGTDNTFGPLLLEGLDVVPYPLAAGDLNGDGPADLVLDGKVLLSREGLDAGEVTYDEQPFGASWSTALVVDLNRDSLPDLIAASASTDEILYYRGAGNGAFSPFAVALEGAPRGLTVGDYDGDGLLDLAFAEDDVFSGGDGEQTDALSISFGNAHGAPTAAVRMGDLASIEWLISGNLPALPFDDGLDDLIVASRSASAANETSSPSLAVLTGSPLRQLVAPFRFVGDGRDDEVALDLAAGEFTKDSNAHTDLAALTLRRGGVQECPWSPKTMQVDQRASLWRLPLTGEAILSPGTASSVPLEQPEGTQLLWQYGLLTAVDLDGSSPDEVVVLGPRRVPGDPRLRGFFGVLGSDDQGQTWQPRRPGGADSAYQLTEQAFFRLNGRGCEPPSASGQPADSVGGSQPEATLVDSQLLVADLDGVPGDEILVLGFDPGSPNPDALAGASSLVVLPNDGSGSIDARGTMTIALLDNALLRSFAVLNADGDAALEIALLTDTSIIIADLLLDPSGSPPAGRLDEVRTVPLPPGSLSGFDRLVSGDFDGDGLADLALSRRTDVGVVIMRGLAVRD